jgi:hypothetical protein
MIKALAIFGRKPGWSETEFLAHYIERHAPLVAGTAGFTRNCARYLQNYRLAPEGIAPIAAARHDRGAISEMWFENFEAMAATYAAEDYLANVRPDEHRFADFESASVFVCDEHEILPLLQSSDPDKKWALQPRHHLFVFRASPADGRTADLQEAWLASSSIIRATRAFKRYVRRYVQAHRLASQAADLPAPEDSTAVIDEFTFDTLADAAAFWRLVSEEPAMSALENAHLSAPANEIFFSRSHPVFDSSS